MGGRYSEDGSRERVRDVDRDRRRDGDGDRGRGREDRDRPRADRGDDRDGRRHERKLSRSRDWKRSRSRSRSRDRRHTREEDGRRLKSRSRSPHGDSKRRRSGAHDPDPNTGAAAPSTDPEIMQDGVVAAPAGDVGPSEPVDYDAALTPEEIQMMMAMGIPFGFDSTHGKHVDVPDEGAVKVKTTRTARQYMNRRGGFNRALPAERTGQKVHGD